MTNTDVERRVGQPIALVLLDEHPLTRVGVRNVLAQEKDITVVAEAHDFDSALRACRRLRPDVVLVDVDLPPTEMVESIRRLRDECADPAVVVLSHNDSDSDLYQSAVAGASGHLADQVEPAQLAETIRRAAGGDEPISQALAERPAVGRRVLETLRELASQENVTPADQPSPRQREILAYAARGLTNQQIGRLMGLSSSTVRAELAELLKRSGLRHRTQAVVHALQHGWIEAPEQAASLPDESSWS
jgi:DNA-binding NarL/FixJ family response regulator